VGFPGETHEDFEATLELVRRAGFVALFGFKYSPRPYTASQKLEDDVSEELKSTRLARLFETVDVQKNAHLASLVGTRQELLVEGRSKTGGLTGRTARNEIVHLDGQESNEAESNEAESNDGLVGALVEVEVRQAFKNSLLGRLGRVLRSAPPSRGVRAAAPPAARPALAGGARSLPVIG
jgi:tRNA-2-methylthio-N6-dimethylallyladenosine synthase